MQFFSDNTNEIIILSSGKKISVEEIESVYLKSPYIKEVYLFLSDEEKDILNALILPDYDYFKLKGITQIKDRIKWEVENISRTIPSYKHIQKYTIVSQSLPKTPLGKINRIEVKERYLQLISQEELYQKKTQNLDWDSEILSLPICQKVLDFLSQKLKRKVNLDDHLEIDLGLDSLDQIELFLGFQKETGIEISDEDALGLFTVRDVLNKLHLISLKRGLTSQEAPTKWSEILKQEPAQNIKKSIAIRQNPLEKSINFLASLVLIFIARAVFFLRVRGKVNLPKTLPYIICCNHSSFLDGFMIAASLSPFLVNRLFFLGYSAYFKNIFIRWATKLFRLVSIDPAFYLIENMQVCSYILKNSRILCMFPEGVRSVNGEVKEFKKGVGILAKELNVPIVPVYIDGTFNAWPRYRLLPRPSKVKVILGKEILAQDLIKDRDFKQIDIYQLISENLRKEILNLSKESGNE